VCFLRCKNLLIYVFRSYRAHMYLGCLEKLGLEGERVLGIKYFLSCRCCFFLSKYFLCRFSETHTETCESFREKLPSKYI
jgi:hypothetical protein